MRARCRASFPRGASVRRRCGAFAEFRGTGGGRVLSDGKNASMTSGVKCSKSSNIVCDISSSGASSTATLDCSLSRVRMKKDLLWLTFFKAEDRKTHRRLSPSERFPLTFHE